MTGLLPSMDLYVNACWFGYLGLAGYNLFRHFRGYAPVARQQFLITLMMMLLAAGSLRLVIVLQATGTSSFRDGLPYLFVLGVLFLLTCQILLTALRRPDLLSVPGSHVKYAVSALEDIDLDGLDRRLAQLLEDRRPYLDPDFALAELGVLLDTPARQVSQLINARHGMNFSAYMNFSRARTAARLLVEHPDKPIKVVMHESGFRSKSIFNREFSRHFGASPGEFRHSKTHSALHRAEPASR
jgi:AraC-like DNA-binding protein